MVLQSASLTDFCGIPLVSLRENSVTELDLGWEGVGVPGAIVLSSLMLPATALKSLKYANFPCSPIPYCQQPLTCPCGSRAQSLQQQHW